MDEMMDKNKGSLLLQSITSQYLHSDQVLNYAQRKHHPVDDSLLQRQERDGKILEEILYHDVMQPLLANDNETGYLEEITSGNTTANTSDVGAYNTNGRIDDLCRTYYESIAASTKEDIPFWQRASTIWLTVTLSLFILTLIAAAINVYIKFLQHTRRKKTTFYSFLTSVSGMRQSGGGGGGAKEQRKGMKFKGISKH